MSVRIYGKHSDLAVDPFHKFSCVAVVFKGGEACRILSDGFFCSAWLEGQNLEALGSALEIEVSKKEASTQNLEE